MRPGLSNWLSYGLGFGMGILGTVLNPHEAREREALDRAWGRLQDCTPVEYRPYGPEGRGRTPSQPSDLHIGRWEPRNVAIQIDGEHYLYVYEDKAMVCTGLEYFDSGKSAKCVAIPMDELLQGRR